MFHIIDSLEKFVIDTKPTFSYLFSKSKRNEEKTLYFSKVLNSVLKEHNSQWLTKKGKKYFS